MAIVTIGSSKGGAGKSTQVTNLAVIRKLAGDDVLLMDGDTQQSCSLWETVREANKVSPSIQVNQRVGEGFAKSVKETASRYGTTFIDVPGNNAIELRSAMAISNLLVIPLRPSNFDTWVFASDMQLVEHARVNNPDLMVLIVMNGLSAQPNVRNREIRDMRDVLSNYSGFDVADAYICNRSAFNKAIAEGKGVIELEDNSPSTENAKTELMAVYNEIFTYLEKGVSV